MVRFRSCARRLRRDYAMASGTRHLIAATFTVSFTIKHETMA
jgi:hypothetical protein